MDVCYPFRENFEQYSKPEGTWENFEESIEEAKEYERTGQFIVLTSAAAAQEESSSSESEEVSAPRRRRTVAKRKRPAHSSDEDTNFGDSDDEDGGRGKKGGRRKAAPKTRATAHRAVRASKEQKLFAREIFSIVKAIEKEVKEKNLDGALALLKKFDPKAIVKRVNKEGLTVDAPGPYANIETQVVHISRLGRFVHGLVKEHETDIIGPYAQLLYSHLRTNARREFALPDDVDAYISNQAHVAPKKSTTVNTTATNDEEREAAGESMDVTITDAPAPSTSDMPAQTPAEAVVEVSATTESKVSEDAAPVEAKKEDTLSSMDVATNGAPTEESAPATIPAAKGGAMEVDA